MKEVFISDLAGDGEGTEVTLTMSADPERALALVAALVAAIQKAAKDGDCIQLCVPFPCVIRTGEEIAHEMGDEEEEPDD